MVVCVLYVCVVLCMLYVCCMCVCGFVCVGMCVVYVCVVVCVCVSHSFIKKKPQGERAKVQLKLFRGRLKITF